MFRLSRPIHTNNISRALSYISSKMPRVMSRGVYTKCACGQIRMLWRHCWLLIIPHPPSLHQVFTPNHRRARQRQRDSRDTCHYITRWRLSGVKSRATRSLELFNRICHGPAIFISFFFFIIFCHWIIGITSPCSHPNRRLEGKGRRVQAMLCHYWHTHTFTLYPTPISIFRDTHTHTKTPIKLFAILESILQYYCLEVIFIIKLEHIRLPH